MTVTSKSEDTFYTLVLHCWGIKTYLLSKVIHIFWFLNFTHVRFHCIYFKLPFIIECVSSIVRSHYQTSNIHTHACKSQCAICEFCQGWVEALCVTCHPVFGSNSLPSIAFSHLSVSVLFHSDLPLFVCVLMCVRVCLHVLYALSDCSQLIKTQCQLSCFQPACLPGVCSSRHHALPPPPSPPPACP